MNKPIAVSGSPVIRLDHQYRGLVERKLAEYEERLAARDPYQPPELHPAWYAARIAKEVLEHEEVYTWELCRAIADEQGGYIARPDAFERYCAVVKDYATTGGQNASTSRGT